MAEAGRRRLWFDATRLLARGRFATPTGIDRVDLAYAQALTAAPDFELRLLVVDALGPRTLGAAAGAALIADTARRWHRDGAGESPGFAALRGWLAAPAGTPRPAAPDLPKPRGERVAEALRLGGRLRRPVPRDGAEAGLYVNTSHGRLYRAALARWLERRAQGGVFFIHDLIPIEHPEYNRAAEAERHAARLRVVARHARAVIVNSQATRAALHAWLDREGLRQPPVEVIPLGVAEAFLRPEPPPTAALPYFVALGTIEPRKNHALLLNLWSKLAERLGPASPRLLVIGRRGWENETVFNLLDRRATLRTCVVEMAGLRDAEIARLLRGARALLAPSFAEGYGLPVAEALACGCPVIASDLVAHREVGGAFAEYLDPLDGAAWMAAITSYADDHSPRRAARLAALPGFQATGWDAHCAAALMAIRRAAES